MSKDDEWSQDDTEADTRATHDQVEAGKCAGEVDDAPAAADEADVVPKSVGDNTFTTGKPGNYGFIEFELDDE